MNVFVTGGTGFVGREVVRSLSVLGHSVRLLARHPDSPPVKELLREERVQACAGDVTDPSSLKAALCRSEAVVHLVGIISEVGRMTFENVHVGGTSNVLAAAKAHGVRRLVHMSALGTRPASVSRYHQTKWAAEEAVRGSGLSWTIFRPSLIYGPQDQFVNLFARVSKYSPFLPLLGRRDARFQPVAVQLVAKAFAAAVTEPRSEGQEYSLCGVERLTLAEILDTILTVLGRRRLKLRVPEWAAQAQARFLEWFFPQVLGKSPPFNRDQLTMLDEGNEGDGRAANQLFGLQHPRFREGIATYLRT